MKIAKVTRVRSSTRAQPHGRGRRRPERRDAWSSRRAFRGFDGEYEAVELRDGQAKRYLGKGVTRAVRT